MLNSHADIDHTAGNADMRELAPGAIFMCHTLDQRMVEDLEVMIRERYEELAIDHGIGESAESKNSMRTASRTVAMDVLLSGGERIRLGTDWTVEVLHTPGHSRGHLTIYDPRSQALIICDTTLWNAVLRKDGSPAFPPTYRFVDTYVASMNRLAGMQAKLLLTSHYPIYRDAQVGEFLAESRAYVDRVDQALIAAIRNAATPPTLRELTQQLGPSLGEWPRAADIYLWNPFIGHLERLVQLGLLTTGKDKLQIMNYERKLRERRSLVDQLTIFD